MIDRNKLIIMNEDQIEFIYLINDQPVSVKNKTIIDPKLFNKSEDIVYVNKDIQKVFSSRSKI